jgi:Ca-activated chloride channel family protein
LYLAADKVTKDGKKDKKALLLITDGEDNASKYGINKVIEALRQAKVTLYAVGLLEENDPRGGLFKKPPSKKAKDDLLKFVEITGGQAYFPKSLDEVEELVKTIAHDLLNHYTISYNPTNANLDGSWREITVKINPPKPCPSSPRTQKQGYYAPKAGASPTTNKLSAMLTVRIKYGFPPQRDSQTIRRMATGRPFAPILPQCPHHSVRQVVRSLLLYRRA